MNTEAPFDQDLDKEVTSTELDEVLDANKDLYNQLNQIPEIEAIEAISIEEDIASESEKESNPLSEFFSRVQGFYNDNELVRYASWALVLILLSTTALTILEYDMFYNDVIADVDGSFTFGDTEPNWLDTFFHTFWWSIVTFTTVG